MSPPDLRDLFGSAAPWLANLCLLVLCVIFAVGLKQKREITFWPPKLGPPPEVPTTPTTEPAGEMEQSPESTAVPPPAAPISAPEGSPYDYMEIFEVDRAAEFYQEIAPVYDGRNSGDLVATHLATISRIHTLLDTKPALRVVDLGGGTGNPIATAFYANDKVEWTYVDICRGMEAQFKRNLSPHPLGQKIAIESGDLRRVCRRLPAGNYDLVLLSLVLTSMLALPDFADIARLLAPGGQLIVTDVGPGYTRLEPLYEVRVDGRLLALCTVPVDPLEVMRQAIQAGLTLTELTPLGDGKVYYSFVGSFCLPGRAGVGVWGGSPSTG